MSWWEGQNNGALAPLLQGLNCVPEWKPAGAGEGGNAARAGERPGQAP